MLPLVTGLASQDEQAAHGQVQQLLQRRISVCSAACCPYGSTGGGSTYYVGVLQELEISITPYRSRVT
jgi:hypothetical protein